MSRPMNVYGEPTRHPEPDVRYGETVTNVDPLGNLVPEPGEPFYTPEPVRHPRYLVPPGLARQAAAEAAAEAKPETASMVDAVAEDTKAKTEWPENCPAMRPLFKLPFRQRGTAMKLFREIEKSQAAMPEREEGDPVTLEYMEATYENLARMDDFLVTCAVDPDAYRAWVLDGAGAEEGIFVQFWNAFTERMQPGEAYGSSS
jgi:hypothetical protein